MKKLIALLLILALTVSFLGCQPEELRSPGNFYYYRSGTVFSGTDSVIAPEQRELAGIENDLTAIVELYCAGPLNRDYENLLPDGCPVPVCTQEGDVLYLHFSSEFAALTGLELTVAASCFTRTLLELTGSRTLVLTADGALLNGETSLTLTLSQLGLRDDSRDRLQGDYTVYYTGTDRRYLVGQTVTMDQSFRDALPEQLLEQIRSSPKGAQLGSPLPYGTRILSVTTEDGLCTVDLSREFENRRFYSHTEQLLSLMGMVNTLTSLPEIDRVEFTVEGELLVRYGALTVSGPLVQDERFIGPVRTSLGEKDATLYLTHGEPAGLIPLPTRLRQTGAVSPAEMMLRALLSDSGLNGFSSRIPAGTQLNSVRLENRICRVDLSGEYLESPEDLLWAGRVITASLCTLDGISAVQITVDGSVPEEFDPALFGVLTPNEDWFL